MKRVLVTGAGGSPAANFIRSLRLSPEKFYIVGADANKYYLMRAEVDKRYLVPYANDSSFLKFINKIIKKENIHFVHIQNDTEVRFFSENREKVEAKTFLPSKQTVNICHNKYFSYKRWKRAGIKVPETISIRSENDLKKAFKLLGGKVWLRATTGAGGRGSLPTGNYETAKAWIDFKKGWGEFTAAELLGPETITWMSIWSEGKLIVAQGRKRLYWELSKISPSGVSGVTGTGLTVSDSQLDKIAQKTIYAIDKKPNGLFGVDMVYDTNGIPNPTEINIGRFFTTHHFFTEAGLNMPYIFVKIAFSEDTPKIRKKLNPLKDNLLWIRGVDFFPVLTDVKKIKWYENKMDRMKNNLKESN
jgi:carbamoyl-phosphate synthase large subunit